MMGAIFVILYIAFPIFLFYLLYRNGINLFKVDLFQIIIWAMFIFAYAGTLPVYFGWDPRAIRLGLTDQGVVLQTFAYTTYSILFMCLGFIVMTRKLGQLPDFRPDQFRSFHWREGIALTGLLAVIVLVLIYYLSQIEDLAIWIALTEGAGAANLARSKMGNDFPGRHHWYTLFFHHALNIIVWSLFAGYLIGRKWKDLAYFFIPFLLAVFTATMAAEKAPIVMLMLGLIFVWLLIAKRSSTSWKTYFSIGLIATGLLFIVYAVIGYADNPGKLVYEVFWRIVIGQYEGSYQYVFLFPDHWDFLYGRSFPNPGGILPYEPFRLTVEVMNYRNPGISDSGIVGSIVTVYWAEMYANFGIWGVLIPPFFIGIGLYLLTFIMKKIESIPLVIGFYIWLILHYWTLSGSGLSGFIIDFYLFLLVVIFSCIYLIANSGRLPEWRESDSPLS